MIFKKERERETVFAWQSCEEMERATLEVEKLAGRWEVMRV